MFKCNVCQKFAPSLHDARLCESNCFKGLQIESLQRRIVELELKMANSPLIDGQHYQRLIMEKKLELQSLKGN